MPRKRQPNTKPKTRTVYTFRSGINYPFIEMIETRSPISPRDPARVRPRTITLSTYGRFVRLANTHRYPVWILEGDMIEWEMWVR